MRLKFAFEPIISGIWGDDQKGDENDIVCVRVADFDDVRGRVSTGRLTIRNISVSEQKGRLLRKGDLLLEKSGGGEQTSVGRSVLFDHGFIAVCSNFIALLRPRQKHDFRFLTYLMRALYHGGGSIPYIKQTTGIQNLDCSSYLSREFNFPSQDAERCIANYLDQQTAKIDRLISLRQRQIALLKEQRAALIQQAVTRGLNPDVPMKDSGLPWLGEIPAHWNLTKARFVSDIFVPQRNKPELNEVDGYYWVTMEEMVNPMINVATYRVSEKALSTAGSRLLPKGSVIASCVGNFGVASINTVPVVINQQLQAFIPKKIDAEFLRLVLIISSQYFELIATAATLLYVNQIGFSNLPIPLPPIDEQKKITEFINNESLKVNSLQTAYSRQLTLLTEYRAALIHECVTGQRVIPDHFNTGG